MFARPANVLSPNVAEFRLWVDGVEKVGGQGNEKVSTRAGANTHSIQADATNLAAMETKVGQTVCGPKLLTQNFDLNFLQ